MGEEQVAVRIVRRINEVPREAWDSLLRDGSPFMRWDWLDCLEDSGCVCDKTGWAPHHLVVERGEEILGGCPMYLKSHSMGEFVFDHQWAGYAMQAGIEYYPKMLVGVPFTPVVGSRFLTAPGVDRGGVIGILGRALVEICRSNELSSIHINFCSQDEMDALEDLDFIPKIGLQFHWENREYETFDDYLGAFRSERRNKIKRERRELDKQGIGIRALPYDEITPDIQRTLFELYKHHIDRLYYGHQYLNGRFFDELLKRPYPFLCPIVAQRDGRIIAGPSTSAAPTPSTAATGAPSKTTATCTSTSATTPPSSTASTSPWSASRPAPAAASRTSAASSPPRPTAPTTSGTSASETPSRDTCRKSARKRLPGRSICWMGAR